MNRHLKCSLKILIGIVAFLSVSIFGLLFTNVGREFVMSCVGKYLKYHNIELSVNGIGSDFKTFNEINIKTPDNTELHFWDVYFDGKKQFNDHEIKIGKLIITRVNNDGDSEITAPKIVSYFGILKKFVSSLDLNEVNFNGLHVSNLQYKSSSTLDKISAKINNTYDIDAKVTWNFFGCKNVSITFGNIYGFSGTCVLEGNKLSKYSISAANNFVKLDGYGSYKDFEKEIFIDSMSIFYNQKKYVVSGIAYPEKKIAKLKSEMSFNEYFKNLPQSIRSIFENTTFAFDIDYRFGGKSFANIDVKKDGNVLGKAKCILNEKNLDINGDISWINAYGFNFKNFNCKIKNFEDANIFVTGNNFNITSRCNKNSVLDFKFEIPSKGYLKSTSPFAFNSSAKIPFEFDFKDIGFLIKKGDLKGSGEYQNGEIKIRNKSKKLEFDKYEICDADILFEKNNAVITAKNFSVFSLRFSNFEAKLKGESFNIKCKTANGFWLSLGGKTSDSYQKISLNSFNVALPKSNLKIKAFNLDFVNKNHKILCEIFKEKTKGVIDISVKNDFYNIIFDSVDTEFLRQAFSSRIPQCSINGKINLDMENSFAKGDGKLKILGLIFKKNIMDLTLSLSEIGTKLKANLENASEYLKIDAYLPFLLKKDGGVIQKSDSLYCTIKGNTKIENFLELSDMKDARGVLNCNLQLSGSMYAPVLTGDACLKNAYFVINDVVLKNGFISLKCIKNNIINIEKAYFIDGKGQKAIISGYGKFFFDNLVPNINTNLGFSFDRFRLFDSDDMRITVTGSGTIYGKINDLTIKGNVSVPKCEIINFGTNNNSNRIQIDNEKHIPRKNLQENKHDFCKYDVNMSCPHVAVIGKVFEIDLYGKLRLLTYQGKTSMSGSLKASRGKISIFGKRMKLTNGDVIFIQENPFDPKVYFMCENNFGDLTAYLEIINKPRDGMSINLTSRPVHSQDTILSNIMFGKSTKNLGVTEAAQLAHAVSSLKNKGGLLSIFDTFQNIGVIDSISFSANSTQLNDSLNSNERQSDSSGINISAGKYVHDNVYVSVNKKSEEDSASLDIDVSLSDTLSVKANTNGEAGVSWKYRY